MLDVIWVIISAALVLLMQAGFTCLETGLIRSKNSINVAIKNLMDLCISGAIFWLFGYGVMFGTSVAGFYGSTDFLFGHNVPPLKLAFFLFQMMFCGTAITIVSGAVAERMSIYGYLVTALIMSALIYPVIGHWAWSGLLTDQFPGWLRARNFIDFAGSSVVHSVGGWVSLAMVIIIGPRIGRFNDNMQIIQGHNLPMSVLGVMLLWFGWFGFNGGSTLGVSENIPAILLNTCLAAMFAGLSALFLQWLNTHVINAIACMNGVLGGLVGITASCDIMPPISAVIIGIVSGIVVIAGEQLLEKLKIDDAIGVIPVHLFAGIWGTLAVVLCAPDGAWGTELDYWSQLQIQMFGIVTIGAYAFSVSFLLLSFINRFYPLRVSAESELSGLNISEHQASTEILDLLTEMETHKNNANFSMPVAVEPFTEAGQIAKQYNQVLERVNNEISHHELAIKNFKASETRKDAILKKSLDCIITINQHGLIKEFNPAAERCFGYNRQQIIGRSFIEYFVLKENQQDFVNNLQKNFSINSQLSLNRHNRITLHRMHDIEFQAEITISQVVIKATKKKEFNFHIRDITRQHKIQNKITELAFHDSLTGLYNRSFLHNTLQEQIDFAKRDDKSVALMFLDLDEFKTINDNFGHKTGDKVLIKVAELLTKITRQGDIICRWGGDEFIILFSNLHSKDSINQKTQKILQSIRKPLLIDGYEFKTFASIGIAISFHGEIPPDRLIQQADIAMFEAKNKGKNTYCVFLPEMEDKITYRFQLESDLRQALVHDQFYMEYQPKVNCASNQLDGLEALLRWRHPEHGLISPGVFIPILEKSSLMEEVSKWVLTTVCEQIHQWQNQGLMITPIAINLSGKDFLIENLHHRIASILKTHEIEGKHITLEITETVLATDTEQCIATMKKIKQLGVKFAIDDFGTGYSSMSYLKKFPIDTLKIDRAFINNCHNDNEDAAICTAIIALGKNLGLQIVAEGVETESQLAFLQHTDCDIYQGFLFSPPISAEEAGLLLAEAASKPDLNKVAS